MYSNDRLVAITHNGFTYNLAYDIWGQLTSVSVGDTTIISYKYGSGVNRDRITQSIYHNGDFENSSTTTTKYEYKNGNVSKVRVNNVVKYLYEYDSQGNLTSVSEINSRTVKYTDGRTDIIDYKTKDVIYSSYTNDDGDLIEVINGVTYTSKSYDSAYDIATGITTEFSDVSASNGKVIGTVDKQDWFGRYTESIVKTESANDTSTENKFASVKTEYAYPEYEGNKTSNRIESYSNTITYGTDTSTENKTNFYGFAYDYDNNGNIIAEYKQGVNGAKTLRYSYVYDEFNQLVRVNDKVSNTTYTYTYDGAGNIVSKAEYIYTTDETITDEAEKVTNYTYDTVWKDKLATYDGKAFTYDNIGNPLTFDGASFTWMGRELTKYTKDGKEITFQYDENGLRHRKIVKENDVVVEQYDYVWSDGSLISQTYTNYAEEVTTSDTARFIYDSWGTLQGFILNDSETYLYVKNLQGDIIAIVDEFGEVIVEYSYDAWGNVTFHETSLQNMTKASTLCFVSPFTYRGYCYDYDIELYYLQSRYYSAEIGRFINTDDTQIAVATQGTVLGANLFAYCENNPINYCDFNGNKSMPWWVKIAIGTAGIITAVIVTVATGGAAFPALVAALKKVAGTMAISMAIEGTIGYIVNGKAGLKEGLIEGALNGFMWGGIASAMSAISKVLSLKKCGTVKSSKCFVAGTLIKAENGYIPIEDIKIGDKVYSENPITGELELKEVIETYVRETTELISVCFNGTEVLTTAEHPFWVTGNGWVNAECLRIGDELLSVDGNKFIITNISIEKLKEPITVYNFEVSDFHTYFVSESSILVHNADCGFKNIRTLQNTKIKGYKVSMDVERGGSNLVNIHLKVDNTKYIWNGTDFVSKAGKKIPSSLRNSSIIKSALEKAIDHMVKGRI